MKIIYLSLFVTLDTINDLLWSATSAIDNVLVALAERIAPEDDADE